MESDYREKLGFLSWSKNSNSYTTSPHSQLFVSKLKSSNYSPCSSLRDSLVERQKVGILIASQVLPAHPWTSILWLLEMMCALRLDSLNWKNRESGTGDTQKCCSLGPPLDWIPWASTWGNCVSLSWTTDRTNSLTQAQARDRNKGWDISVLCPAGPEAAVTFYDFGKLYHGGFSLKNT